MTGPDLPLRVRRAARVLVLDQQQRLLLMHDSDVGLPGRPEWWITPGGGIEEDETPVAAAVRELQEETGLAVVPADLVGPVLHRGMVRHRFSDHRSEQEETFYALGTTAFRPSTTGLTPEERETVLGSRWWSLAELEATTEAVWPGDLVGELPGVLAGLADDPAWGRPPVELPDLDEDPREV